jgi:hypothetical protein
MSTSPLFRPQRRQAEAALGHGGQRTIPTSTICKQHKFPFAGTNFSEENNTH